MDSIKKNSSLKKVFNFVLSGKALYFSVPFLLFFVVGGFLILFLKKGEIVLFINSISNETLDFIFLNLTHTGLGSFIVVLALLLVLYKYRWSMLAVINLLWVTFFTNIFKRIFFHLAPRPFHYFYYDDFPRFLYDAPLSYFNTFPSGHTMTIYAFCSLLAFLINRRLPAMLLFVWAFFVGVSRIYLLQHFFIDTWAGASLGIISTLLTLWIDERFNLKQKSFANSNLVKTLFPGKFSKEKNEAV